MHDEREALCCKQFCCCTSLLMANSAVDDCLILHFVDFLDSCSTNSLHPRGFRTSKLSEDFCNGSTWTHKLLSECCLVRILTSFCCMLSSDNFSREHLPLHPTRWWWCTTSSSTLSPTPGLLLSIVYHLVSKFERYLQNFTHKHSPFTEVFITGYGRCKDIICQNESFQHNVISRKFRPIFRTNNSTKGKNDFENWIVLQ